MMKPNGGPGDQGAAGEGPIVAAQARVAFIGTGLMGGHMTRRMAAAGLHVSAWNRTGSKARALESDGVHVAADPVAAVEDADVVICMLSDGKAVSHVLFETGLADALRRGSAVIDMSSIAPAMAREHATRLNAVGVAHLDAPVSGGTIGAAAGTLAIMVGGEQADFERYRGLLDTLGTARYVGAAGSGQIAKLTNQIIVAVTICAVAEGLLLAQQAGVEPTALIASLKGGFADSRILQEHGARMADRSFEPGGPVRLHLKDLHTALDVASSEGLKLPASGLVTRLYEQLSERDGSELDHSALLLEIEHLNDLDADPES